MDTVVLTGGKYSGRKISTPGGATHPMGSRERLALFNMLAGEIEGIAVLDAFAGSGALGLEALSRGARSVIFVDNSVQAIKTIKQNLDILGISEGFKIIKSTVSEAASNLGKYDAVLADPPYDKFELKEIECLASLTKDNGILVLSHPGEAPELSGLDLEKSRAYAGAHISIYRKTN